MSRDFLSEKWDLPTRDFLQLEKKKKQTNKQKPTHFCGTSPYVFICDTPPWGSQMCLDWSGYGGDAECTVCHAMSYGNFWNISHVDCAKILNDDILDGMVLGDSDAIILKFSQNWIICRLIFRNRIMCRYFFRWFLVT